MKCLYVVILFLISVSAIIWAQYLDANKLQGPNFTMGSLGFGGTPDSHFAILLVGTIEVLYFGEPPTVNKTENGTETGEHKSLCRNSPYQLTVRQFSRLTALDADDIPMPMASSLRQGESPSLSAQLPRTQQLDTQA